uniref:Ig-like domain-containing protein n=1 Tax=Neolamprologus brichardi TaxID=32507 RepID=A0A3Q4I052_NEOBR
MRETDRVWLRCWQFSYITLLLLYHTVTDSVSGLVGENVLLTCVYTNDFPLLENVTVFWYQKDKPVFYILDGVPSDEYQDQMFTGRVLSFPDQYKEQNFSIILKNIQLSDSGFYDCFIPMVGFKSQVHLIVSVLYPLHTQNKSTQLLFIYLTIYLAFFKSC